jgi:hypothetical protein
MLKIWLPDMLCLGRTLYKITFGLNCSGSPTNSTATEYFNCTGSDQTNEVLFENLGMFKTYSFIITACTSAGCAPASDPLYFTTLESGKLHRNVALNTSRQKTWSLGPTVLPSLLDNSVSDSGINFTTTWSTFNCRGHTSIQFSAIANRNPEKTGEFFPCIDQCNPYEWRQDIQIDGLHPYRQYNLTVNETSGGESLTETILSFFTPQSGISDHVAFV